MIKVNQDKVTSILVILTASLGDVVRGLAILQPLKEQLDNVEITWLIEDKWKTVLNDVIGIDHVMVFERKQGLRGILKVISDLRHTHFDIVLDMQRHLKSGLFSLVSGAKKRIGFHPLNAKEFNFLFNNEYLPKCEKDYPKIYHYMKFVEHLGVTWREPLDFGLPITKKNNSIAVVLGSSKKEKDWTVEQYISFIRKLLCFNQYRIILLGDLTQIKNAERICNEVGSMRVENYVGKTSLNELIQCLSMSKLAIGPDSGPGHISAAVNTPYIALFGPTCVRRVAPYKCENLVVQAQSGVVSDITADEVLSKVSLLL